MAKTFVVFLNGPPGSGKDFAADVLMHDSVFHVETFKFAAPLKNIAAMLLGVHRTWIEKNKTTVVQPYNVTVRQLLIDISEKWMKPCYGNDIFGKLCAAAIADSIQHADMVESNVPGDGTAGIGLPELIVISDSGFDKEAKEVLKLFGADNALLIRIHRDGHTFMGDSRSYIEIDDVHSVDINNSGTADFGHQVISVVEDWMKEKKNG